MKIAFHSNQLGLRGTEIALYDYAHYSEEILANQSIILTNLNAPFHDHRAIQKFGARFPVYAYADWEEAERILEANRIDVLYCIKAGLNDGLVSKTCKTVVHSVFKYCEPHGHVYAYVSEWLAKYMSSGTQIFPFVPHIVELPRSQEHLRQQLKIPDHAVVFGRHGGAETFDVKFAQEVVQKVAAALPERYFVFMNTDQFCAPRHNIVFLEGAADVAEKERFINTCDAMLHARESGETFGLAVAEFSVRQRPVLTWAGSHERSHIELLGEKGIYYKDASDLEELLRTFKPNKNSAWDVYSQRFSPRAVMEQFQRVFL